MMKPTAKGISDITKHPSYLRLVAIMEEQNNTIAKLHASLDEKQEYIETMQTQSKVLLESITRGTDVLDSVGKPKKSSFIDLIMDAVDIYDKQRKKTKEDQALYIEGLKQQSQKISELSEMLEKAQLEKGNATATHNPNAALQMNDSPSESDSDSLPDGVTITNFEETPSDVASDQIEQAIMDFGFNGSLLEQVDSHPYPLTENTERIAAQAVQYKSKLEIEQIEIETIASSLKENELAVLLAMAYDPDCWCRTPIISTAMEMYKLRSGQTLTQGRFDQIIKILDTKYHGLIEQYKISGKGIPGSPPTFLYLTEKGKAVVETKVGQPAILSFPEMLIREHTTLEHGYPIYRIAEVLKKTAKYKSKNATINYETRKNEFKISGHKSYIPDITVTYPNSRGKEVIEYWEYETGKCLVEDMMAKLEKFFLHISDAMYIVVQSPETLAHTVKAIEQWEAKDLELRPPQGTRHFINVILLKKVLDTESKAEIMKDANKKLFEWDKEYKNIPKKQ